MELFKEGQCGVHEIAAIYICGRKCKLRIKALAILVPMRSGNNISIWIAMPTIFVDFKAQQCDIIFNNHTIEGEFLRIDCAAIDIDAKQILLCVALNLERGNFARHR